MCKIAYFLFMLKNKSILALTYSRALDAGFAFTSDIYSGSKIKHRYVCLKAGHEVWIIPNAVQQGVGCGECFHNREAISKTKEYNARHSREWRRRNAHLVHAKKQDVLDFKRSVKSVPCMDCGKQYHPVAMEFDHLPGYQKKYKISHNGLSKHLAQQEIVKCEVVCIFCHRLRTHQRYQYSNSKTARVKRALKAKVDVLKDSPCVICNIKYLPFQMDFDHIDPSQKLEKISDMVRRRASLKDILTEVSKCRLLCALCHRLHTEKLL